MSDLSVWAKRLLESVWKPMEDSQTKRTIIAEQLRVLKEAPSKPMLYYSMLADALERCGHQDAAKAIRELLATVEQQAQRIEAPEHCVVALGGEVDETAEAWDCDFCFDDDDEPCGECIICDPAAHDPEVQVQR